jgi:hypothetical protein
MDSQTPSNPEGSPQDPDSLASFSSRESDSLGFSEQRALALPPQSFAFELTEDFRAAFEKRDAAIELPSAYRLAWWQKEIGDPHWSRIQDEVAEKNRKLEEQHAKGVAEVERLNRLAEETYKKELAEYEARHTQYLKAVKEAERIHQLQLEEFVKKQARNNLEEAIQSQDNYIETAIENTRTATAYEVRELERVVRGVLFGSVILHFLPEWQLYSGLGCSFAYVGMCGAKTQLREKLEQNLTRYPTSRVTDKATNEKLGIRGWPRFYLHERKYASQWDVFTPVLFPPATDEETVAEYELEEHPLGEYEQGALQNKTFAFEEFLGSAIHALLSALPFLGVIMNWRLFFGGTLSEAVKGFGVMRTEVSNIQSYRRRALRKLLEDQLERPEVVKHLVEQNRAKMELR